MGRSDGSSAGPAPETPARCCRVPEKCRWILGCMGDVQSETQRWAREKRRQTSQHGGSHGGYDLLGTYQGSDPGVRALPITLFNPPARWALISHFTDKG